MRIKSILNAIMIVMVIAVIVTCLGQKYNWWENMTSAQMEFIEKAERRRGKVRPFPDENVYV